LYAAPNSLFSHNGADDGSRVLEKRIVIGGIKIDTALKKRSSIDQQNMCKNTV